MTQGLLIAAPRSGSGKTTLTLGLLRALAQRGWRVNAFKCGPDYIDPAFHAVATGRTSFTLDSWTMSPQVLAHNFARGCANADMVVAEGSMGLFDGVATQGATGSGASADIAERFNLPVLLIIDASGQSQSAGAVVHGFGTFNPQVRLAGVILGNVASARHTALATRGIEQAGFKVLGTLPRGCVPPLPERHLGLVQAQELPNLNRTIDALAQAIAQHIDIDAVVAAMAPVAPSCDTFTPPAPPAACIALAQDAAFSFMYPHVLANWQQQGVRVLPFSPLANEAPSPEAEMCWLPGGYPELYAAQLSNNSHFLQQLQQFAAHKPVHGECGGYMVLGDAIIDAQQQEWPMAGLLPLTTSYAARKLHLGYRAMRLHTAGVLGAAGQVVRGHEFHYSSIVAQGDSQTLGSVCDANGTPLGNMGQRVGMVSGTFFHAVA